MRKVVLAGCLVIVLAGCAALFAVIRFFAPNTRMYYRDEITLKGRLDGPKPSYANLKVGNPSSHYDGFPAVFFRIDGQLVVDVAQVDTEWLMAQGAERDARAPSDIGWPAHYERWNLRPGVFFIIFDDKVVNATVVKGRGIELRSDRQEQWAVMPFGQNDAELLFGPPDRLNDFFMH